jgi:hypothetical protein
VLTETERELGIAKPKLEYLIPAPTASKGCRYGKKALIYPNPQISVEIVPICTW